MWPEQIGGIAIRAEVGRTDACSVALERRVYGTVSDRRRSVNAARPGKMRCGAGRRCRGFKACCPRSMNWPAISMRSSSSSTGTGTTSSRRACRRDYLIADHVPHHHSRPQVPDLVPPRLEARPLAGALALRGGRLPRRSRRGVHVSVLTGERVEAGAGDVAPGELAVEFWIAL